MEGGRGINASISLLPPSPEGLPPGKPNKKRVAGGAKEAGLGTQPLEAQTAERGGWQRETFQPEGQRPSVLQPAWFLPNGE